MSGKWLSTVMFAAVAMLVIGTQTVHACGKVEMRDGNYIVVAERPNPKPIKFTTFEDALKTAQQQKQLFIAFFCSADEAKTAGGNEEAFEDYKRNHKGLLPEFTAFDCPIMTGKMKHENMAAYARIIQSPETDALFKQYGVGTRTLVLCAPNGEKLASAGVAARSAVEDILKNAADYLLKWQELQAAKANGATVTVKTGPAISAQAPK